MPVRAMEDNETETFFQAVLSGDAEAVRAQLSQNRGLSSAKHKSDQFKYDPDVELDAYKFLGAYLGSLTALQVAILKGNDQLAKDIMDGTLSKDDLNLTFGGGNTALHLATFLGARDIVKWLLERGADRTVKNNKGFIPVDVSDDEEMRNIYTSV